MGIRSQQVPGQTKNINIFELFIRDIILAGGSGLLYVFEDIFKILDIFIFSRLFNVELNDSIGDVSHD